MISPDELEKRRIGIRDYKRALGPCFNKEHSVNSTVRTVKTGRRQRPYACPLCNTRENALWACNSAVFSLSVQDP